MRQTVKTIIVEDEEKGRKTLRALIERFCPELECAGEAGSVEEGAALIRNTGPGLVFLDIMLPDGNAFDLLAQFADRSFSVIFVTAFEEYALRAFKVAALDYLLKPVNIEMLRQSVARHAEMQARTGLPQQRQQEEMARQHLVTGRTESLLLPTLNGFTLVKAESIIHCEADGNYTRIYLTDGKSQMFTRSLQALEESLAGLSFFRVHHKHMINLRHLHTYQRGRGGIAIMSNGSEIEVSTRRKDEFLQFVERFARGETG